jgi:DNA-binding winged helix-turn-helix (wHTH) protein
MQYEVGPFRVSVHHRNGEPAVDLRRGVEPVPVPDQAGRLLALLLASPGAILSAQDIVRGVWRQDPEAPGCRIDEDNVRVLVTQLRKILDDDGATQRHLETVPRRGYRLREVVPVTQRRPLLTAAAAVVALGAAIAWRAGQAPVPSRPSLAPAPPVTPRPEAEPSAEGRRQPPGRAPRPPSPEPRARAVPAPAEALMPSAEPAAAGPSPPLATPPVPDAVATPAPVAEAPTRPPSDLCPRLEALVTRLADQEAVMNRLCQSRDVGGVLNASGAVFDLAGLSSGLGGEIGALTAYERQLELFLPVGREAEAARAVRAECRDIGRRRSLWRLGWTAVRARAEELRARAACGSGDTR